MSVPPPAPDLSVSRRAWVAVWSVVVAVVLALGPMLFAAWGLVASVVGVVAGWPVRGGWQGRVGVLGGAFMAVVYVFALG